MRIIFSSLLLNLFVFTTTLSLLSTASNVIYDSAGNKLLRGIPYYILPLLRGSGGGLTVSRSTKNGCPFNVTQELFEVNHGVPFTFNPIILDEEFIRASYPTSIEADVTNPCSGSNILKVTSTASGKNDKDELVKSNQDKKKKDDDDDDDKVVAPVKIVTAGGEFDTPESCFQIMEDDMLPGLRSYLILHCPFKCGSSSTVLTCHNVGLISGADGQNYLGPTDALFPVVFTNSFGTFSESGKVSIFSQSAKLTTISHSAK